MTDPWQELESIPPAMADAVKPHLRTASLEGYQRFLEAMVHYTRGSGDRLRHAAARSPSEELRAFFDRLAHEESGHYRLAEADLATFGRAPTGEGPEAVTAFHRSWIESDDPATWLGALYALESVGGHLGEDAVTALGRLGLRRDQVRFVMVHLEADVDHGASTADHARRQLAAAGDRLIQAARDAARFWVGLHIRALSGEA